MTSWQKKIINTFVSHYFSSAAKYSAAKKTEENRNYLRIRSSSFFPDFDSAHPDEKEAYLEAAESLEQKGVAILGWEKGARGERLKAISCKDFIKLFKEAGKPYPKTEAEKTRAMLGAKAEELKEAIVSNKEAMLVNGSEAEKVIALLEFLSRHYNPREIGQGINHHIMEDLVRLFEYTCENSRLEKITIRALSILLYQDSKHLESLQAFCTPLLLRLQKTIPVPDISFLGRSYPEAMISGKIIFEYKQPQGSCTAVPPLVNAKGLILNLPLESIDEIGEIGTIQLMTANKKKSVLTIENKETFYALASPQKYFESKNLSQYDCFLYTGGYPNRAVTTLIKLLAASGFTFYHAGDLDPDGVLILQHIGDIAQRPVSPLRMDAATFNQYLPWARTLNTSMLWQAEKIREDIKEIPGVAELLHCIKETGMGVEQEIVDYR